MIYDLILIASSTVAAWSFLTAFYTYKRQKKGKKGRPLSGIVIGGVFALSLTFLVESVLHKSGDTSFIDLARQNSLVPVGVFMAGALQGIVYEFVGSVALGQWYYPTVHHRRHLWLVLPFFWALFMIIMQDTYAISRSLGCSVIPSLVITSLVPFILIEGINIFTKTWIYERYLKSVALLVVGWFILTYTFVWLFNQFVINPFGY